MEYVRTGTRTILTGREAHQQRVRTTAAAIRSTSAGQNATACWSIAACAHPALEYPTIRVNQVSGPTMPSIAKFW